MRYTPLTDHNSSVPKWLSATLKKAVHPDPKHRYEELSEFLHDFRYPNPELSTEDHRPLLERNPVKFWQGLSIILMGIVIYLIGILPNG